MFGEAFGAERVRMAARHDLLPQPKLGNVAPAQSAQIAHRACHDGRHQAFAA